MDKHLTRPSANDANHTDDVNIRLSFVVPLADEEYYVIALQYLGVNQIDSEVVDESKATTNGDSSRA